MIFTIKSDDSSPPDHRSWSIIYPVKIKAQFFYGFRNDANCTRWFAREAEDCYNLPSLDFAIELPHAFAPSSRPATVQSKVALAVSSFLGRKPMVVPRYSICACRSRPRMISFIAARLAVRSIARKSWEVAPLIYYR